MIKQLPRQQKIKLEKEVVGSKLSKLLSDFETKELDLETINTEKNSVKSQFA